MYDPYYILNRYMETIQKYLDALKEISQLKEELATKDMTIMRLKNMTYGAKSEHRKKNEFDSNQPRFPLWDQELERIYGDIIPAPQIVEALEEEAKQRRQRNKEAKKGERKENRQPRIPANLECRREEVYPEGYNPETMKVIGSEVVRLLQKEPATFYVQEIVYYKCLHIDTIKESHQKIVQQAVSPRLIPSGFVGDSVILEMLVNKFTHHLPEYRQAKMYKEMGVDLSTSSINRWMHEAIDKLYPLYYSQMKLIMQSTVLHVDETTIPINDKPEKTRKGYIWSIVDGDRSNKGLFFYYREGSRSKKVAELLLYGHKGAIITDDCKSYWGLDFIPGIDHLGCWAHARRKFHDVKDNFEEEVGTILRYIGALYLVEEGLKERNASVEEVFSERQSQSVPILNELKQYLLKKQLTCTPKSGLGAAISYTLKLWDNLTLYTTNGSYPIDNNPVERSVRSVALGRKNWLFIKNNESGEDNAVIMTLLRTCELLGVPPLKWLNEITPQLLKCKCDEDYEKLLPYHYKNYFS